MHTVTGHCGNTNSPKEASRVTMQGFSGHCGNQEGGQASYGIDRLLQNSAVNTTHSDIHTSC
jgi:hypothetical protein